MPIYQYRCRECGHEEEVLQGIHEAPVTHCQVCQVATMDKCVTAASFRLSGKGYYETDEKAKSKQRYLSSGSQELASEAVAGAKAASSEKAVSGEKTVASEKAVASEKKES